MATQARSHKSPKRRAACDLANVAFYYLLRVGEYTYRSSKHRTRTKQFRIKDVTFWNDLEPIPVTAPLSKLLTATAATLHISNQKNGTRGQLIHHEASNQHNCPVRALARRISSITRHTHNLDTPISAVYTSRGWSHVLSTDINNVVKDAVTALNLTSAGFHRRLVSSHSLRAGGAMAMKLNGVDRDTIKKYGRWSSDTFLMYIHEQIGAFSANISKLMSTHIPFANIQGPTLLHNT